MSLNIPVFKTRALTATIFVILMLVGLLWNFSSFICLLIIIHFSCWHEFIKLLRKIEPGNYRYYVYTGLLYISLPLLLMCYLSFKTFNFYHGEQFSPLIPCGIFLSIWINDTMAYIIGSLIGKTPFSKISPKKTWEGTIGGAIVCVLLIGYVAAPLAYANLGRNVVYIKNPQHWFAIAAICAVFGVLGDLLESKLKRLAAVKDSGSFMPGHGGFLDRFDSVLIATPFVWLYVFFFTQ